jgi:hypothetical protein
MTGITALAKNGVSDFDIDENLVLAPHSSRSMLEVVNQLGGGGVTM